jgi:hypothetical protein
VLCTMASRGNQSKAVVIEPIEQREKRREFLTFNDRGAVKCAHQRLPVRWIRSSDGVYRPAPMACASRAAVVMVACRGKTFSSSTRCTSSSPSEQQSPTTSSL